MNIIVIYCILPTLRHNKPQQLLNKWCYQLEHLTWNNISYNSNHNWNIFIFIFYICKKKKKKKVFNPCEVIWLISKAFSITLCIWLGLPHPLALGLSHCICGQPLDTMGIQPSLLCSSWGKDGFPWCYAWCFCIYRKGCKMSHKICEQTHILPLPTFLFLHLRIDIVVSLDGFRMLVNIISTNPFE
jgi:hypothetical protein